jgi:hypothetical protein
LQPDADTQFPQFARCGTDLEWAKPDFNARSATGLARRRRSHTLTAEQDQSTSLEAIRLLIVTIAAAADAKLTIVDAEGAGDDFIEIGSTDLTVTGSRTVTVKYVHESALLHHCLVPKI